MECRWIATTTVLTRRLAMAETKKSQRSEIRFLTPSDLQYGGSSGLVHSRQLNFLDTNIISLSTPFPSERLSRNIFSMMEENLMSSVSERISTLVEDRIGESQY